MTKTRCVAGFMFALAVMGTLTPLAAEELIPFNGRLEGSVTERKPLPSGDLFLLVTCSGQGTSLGNFDLTLPHTVNLTTREAIGEFEFTAANGDRLYGMFLGEATPTEIPGVVSITEDAFIFGGTGRFEGASGMFTIHRVFDSVENHTYGFYRGVILPRGF